MSTYNGNYSALKTKEIRTFITTQMNLEDFFFAKKIIKSP